LSDLLNTFNAPTKSFAHVRQPLISLTDRLLEKILKKIPKIHAAHNKMNPDYPSIFGIILVILDR